MSNLRFVQKLANEPWLCSAEHVEFLHSILLRYLERTASGERFDPQTVEQAIGRPLDNTREVTIKGGVARIPVEGTIVRRASLFTEISGGVSTETIAKDFITAYNDATVHSILFVFDSPGGEAYGIGELAGIIREKRDLGEKRIEAYCDGMCASAAYWLASATSKITTDATASVGSIGTVVRVRNPDAVKTKQDLEFVSARSPKKRVNPNTEAGREAIQSWIDDMGDEFIQAVADNRGVSFEKVVSDFGQGFVMTGRRAVEAGMADEIGSEGGVVAALIERERSPVPIGVAAQATAPVLELTRDKEEELTIQLEHGESENTNDVADAGEWAAAEPGEASAETILDRIKGLLGFTPTVAQAATGTDNDEPEAGDASGQTEPEAATNGKEPDSGMSEGQQQETVEAMETEGRSEDLSAEEREELLRLRAEREADQAEKRQLAAALRDRGIEALLAKQGSVVLENGARGVMPKAQRDAAKDLIRALAASGADPIELSASGEASLADNEAGRAVSQLLTPWKPVELGERGTQEGEAQSEGAQGDHERVLAELEKRQLGMEHYGAVAGELAAKGEIRRED